MSYLKLFLVFFKIGISSFGGGYAMISIIRENVLALGWLTEAELLNFIAVSESTPGPVAINMATFIGSSQYGFIGSILATLGVVLPSFIIILIISMFISNLLKIKVVNYFLNGVKPCIVAMIISTAIIMLFSTLFSFSKIGDSIIFEFRGIIIFLLLVLIHIIFKKIKRKNPSPIFMILISAVMGIIFYI